MRAAAPVKVSYQLAQDVVLRPRMLGGQMEEQTPERRA